MQVARTSPHFAIARRKTRVNALMAQCGLQGLALSQKNIVPCLRLWARGSPSFLSSVSLAIEGDGAPQGAWPGFRQTGPRVRGSRASPDRRALGVKRHAPRLAAHQRGILAFMPLTVVGPGRLLVAGEAARAPPGVVGCVSPTLAGTAPVPRLQDAS